MSNDMFCRIIRGDMNFPPVQQAVAWLNRNAERNNFDPDVLTYPSTALIQAYEKQSGKPVLYIPVHKVYHLESVGPNPEMDGFKIAAALAQVVKVCAWDAPKDGVGEMWFNTTDPQMAEFCIGHGFFRQTLQISTRLEGDPPPEGQPDERKSVPVFTDMPSFRFKIFR